MLKRLENGGLFYADNSQHSRKCGRALGPSLQNVTLSLFSHSLRWKRYMARNIYSNVNAYGTFSARASSMCANFVSSRRFIVWQGHLLFSTVCLTSRMKRRCVSIVTRFLLMLLSVCSVVRRCVCIGVIVVLMKDYNNRGESMFVFLFLCEVFLCSVTFVSLMLKLFYNSRRGRRQFLHHARQMQDGKLFVRLGYHMEKKC